jgi:hypothetical protein
MISSILIEALARRAMQVYANSPNVEPTVPLLRKAFEEELERFAISSTARPVDAPIKRASLLPSMQPSRGSGIGQQTGGTADSDSAEAKRILTMIADVDIEIIEAVCGERAASFIKEMRGRLSFGGPLCITGKQTFFFRTIKDALVDRGYV